jgi:uncharacterized repeat protein (TIGR03803 family)
MNRRMMKVAVGLCFIVVGLAARPARAQTFKVLHTFHGAPKDGDGPDGTLVRDTAGNLYGTTAGGGNGKGACLRFGGCGTVFELNNRGRRIWQYSIHFPKDMFPEAALLRDKAGDLYGTTYMGGDTKCSESQYGCGTVFKVDKSGKETVLHKFAGAPDGFFPNAPLVEDAAGDLYGTTDYGGSFVAYGAVFKVDKNGKETVLYSFTGGSDECRPVGVTFGPDGDLYGVAVGTTCNQDGAVYKLDKAGHFTLLYTFSGSDGKYPDSTLVFDAEGNLYGETGDGGSSTGCPFGCGVVFELSPNRTETVLYNFCSLSGCTDGAGPGGNLVRDRAGNLYGVTNDGGAHSDCNGGTCGTVFKLDAANNETVLHSFTGGADGAFPEAGLAIDTAGNLYGTASVGGDLSCGPPNGCGVMFKITP